MYSPSEWNCWPDGNIQCLFSLQDLRATNQLATNWVLETVHTCGSARALTWQKGKELRRKCLGVIQCRGKTCHMRLAPATRGVERHRQLQHNCIVCSETLFLHSCGIESSLHLFRDGGYFIHRGSHTHTAFTHSSVHTPDGSLSFIDYTPKYVVSSDVSGAASAPEDMVCDPIFILSAS